MQGYIDEIQKFIQTIESTPEVSDFARSIGLVNDSVDNSTKENDFVTINHTNIDSQTVIVPSSTSSTSSSSTSISSSGSQKTIRFL